MTDVRGGRLSDPSSWNQYDLTSQIDGITDTFIIPVAYISTKILVFLNGLERIVGTLKDYTELSDTQIKFNYIPELGEHLEVWIIKK